MSNIDLFQNNKYVYIKDAIPADICNIFAQYTLFEEKNNFSPEGANEQVPAMHSVYGDSLMESVLLYCKDIIEENTGLNLFPTYSYYRVYRNGASLAPHTDRPACEISATLFLGRNYEGESWPIFIEDKNYIMNEGDLIVYRGRELNHYRYEFEAKPEDFHSQVFLHYVDADGEFSDQRYDGREELGTKK